jgi:thioredoxin-dependent peroxiredoxin
MADFLEPGSEAPDFTLSGDDGRQVRLSELRGKRVVLYFYPRDDTPGCTCEAKSFRDHKADLEHLGATVVGVSPDSTASHQKFREKYQLNFPLLADADHRVSEQFGAWREKTRNGKTSMGIQRSTFLIDTDGVVRKVWKNVSVDEHTEQVLAALEELGQ